MQRLNKGLFITLLTLVGLSGCGGGGGGGGGETPDTTAPRVLNTSPTDGATGIAADQTITVTFSETIDCATVSVANVHLLDAANPVPIQVQCSGASVTLQPDGDLPTNTTLTATIDPSVRDLAGNVLANPYVWSFQVDTIAPRVLNTSPMDGATGIAAAQAITVTFSEAIDCAMVSTANVHLLEADNPVPIQVQCSGAGVTLRPAGDMPTNTTLTATINPSVRDLAGNVLAGAHSWSFDMAPWTRQLGSAEHEFAYATGTDADGNVYVAGSTQGDLDGQGNAGIQDIFVIKYNAGGVQQWLRQLGTPDDEQARALAVDASGNVYVAGYTEGALEGQSNAGSGDIFVIKYDTNGAQQWLRQLGTVSYDRANALTLDAEGNVYVAGYTEGDLGGQGNAGYKDIFVIKYNAGGEQQWLRQLGSASFDIANGVTTDTGGNVYVAGQTNYNLETQTVAPGNQLFIVKYDASGAQQWVRQLGVAGGGTFATSVTTDSADNVYAGGYTTGALGDQTHAGSWDLFITKYDADGAQQWVRQLGTSTNEQTRALFVDADDYVYATGFTVGNLDGQVSAGGWDIFITKYDGSGVQQWLHQFGSSGNDMANGLTADTRGNLFVAGHTYADIDGLSNAGLFDLFVAKYRMDGRKR